MIFFIDLKIVGSVSSVKPGRSESTASQKKLPTGAVSMFGLPNEANPLAAALRSKLGLPPQNDELSDEEEENVPVPVPSASKDKEEEPKQIIFQEDDDQESADLFTPKPLPTKTETVKPEAKSGFSKPVTSSLFADEDDDDDLFGSSTTSKSKEIKQQADFVKEPEIKSNVPVKLPIPKVASTLFDDDDDDDDDLFGTVSKKTEPKPVDTKKNDNPSSLFDQSP